jgi:hypothetical protein
MAPTTPSKSRPTYRDIKLPAYSDDLEPWLTLVEAVLQNTSDSLSDQERYGAILAALPVTKVKDVEHVLLNPARSNKYAALVAALKKTIPQQSDEKTFSLLLTMQLGDREPSRLYEEMTRINKASYCCHQVPAPTEDATQSTGTDRGNDLRQERRPICGSS